MKATVHTLYTVGHIKWLQAIEDLTHNSAHMELVQIDFVTFNNLAGCWDDPLPARLIRTSPHRLYEVASREVRWRVEMAIKDVSTRLASEVAEALS